MDLRKEHIKTLSKHDKIVVHAADIVRKEIQGTTDQISWPPQANELRPEKINIGHFTDLFLNKLLSGEVIPSRSQRVSRLKLSFGQDLIYAVTTGKIKTVKSVLYPSVIKSLSNNTELIRFANLLGHGVCYSILEEIETETAISLIQIQRQMNSVYVPTDFVSQTFTTLVYDNIDRREETMSGSNTSHRVNGIIIQPCKNISSSDTEIPVDPIPPKRQCRRSLTGYMSTVKLDYVGGKRVGPLPMSYPENELKTQLVQDQRRK